MNNIKKLLFTLSVITFNSFATDLIEKAILDSNLEAFTTELENRKRTYVVPFTPNEQLKYLDLSKEVASRRRNYFEFPLARELYSEEKSESIVDAVKFFSGLVGISILSFPLSIAAMDNRVELDPTFLIICAVISAPFFYLLIDGIEKMANKHTERKKSIETKYNNALKIRQLLFDNLTIA